MPKDMNAEEFRGLDAGVGEDSLPPGYYVEFVNIDSFVGNVARARPGLSRITTADAAGEAFVASGTLTDDFEGAEASGTVFSSGDSFSKFNRHAMSGDIDIPQFTSDDSGNIWVQESGAWVSQNPTAKLYVAMAFQYDSAVHGTLSANQHASAHWVSGSAVGNGFRARNVGVACRVQAEENSFYFMYLTYSDADFQPHGYRVGRVTSGEIEFETGGNLNVSMATEYDMRLEVFETGGSTRLQPYVNDAAQFTHSDNTVAGPLTSGIPGIMANVSTITTDGSGTIGHGHLTIWSGGGLQPAITGGSDAPSGHAVVINAFEPFGELNYFYIDASGNRFLFADPREDQ